MSVRLTCPNGHQLQVKEQFAGKKAKCPKCGVTMTVPIPSATVADPGFDVVAEEEDPGYLVVDDIGPRPPDAGSVVQARPSDSRTATPSQHSPRAGQSPPTDDAGDAARFGPNRRRTIALIAGIGAVGFCAVIGGLMLFRSLRGGSISKDTTAALAKSPAESAPPAVAVAADDVSSAANVADDKPVESESPTVSEHTQEAPRETGHGNSEPTKSRVQDSTNDASAESRRSDAAPKRTEDRAKSRVVAVDQFRHAPYSHDWGNIFTDKDGRRFYFCETEDGAPFTNRGFQIRVRTAERDFPGRIRLVVQAGKVFPLAVSSEYIVIVYDDSDGFQSGEKSRHGGVSSTLDVLRTRDLSLLGSIALAHPVTNASIIDDRLIALPRSHCILLPELNPFPATVVSPPIRERSHGIDDESQAQSTVNGWLVGPAIFDPADGSFRFFHSLREPILVANSGAGAIGCPRMTRQPFAPTTKSTGGLIVRPQSSQAILPPRGKHTVHYLAEGGTPPYSLTCSVRELDSGFPDQTKEFLAVDKDTGSVVIDCSILSDRLMNDFHFKHRLEEFSGERTGPAVQVVNEYIRDANAFLKPLLGPSFKPLDGFPVAVSFPVVVSDRAGHQMGLSHQLILELPRAKVLKIIEDAIANDSFSSSTGSKTEHAMRRLEKSPPRNFTRPVFWSDTSRLIEISNALRELWPDAGVPAKLHEAIATLSVLSKMPDNWNLRDEHLNDWPASATAKQRTWKTYEGKTKRGKVTRVSGGSVELDSDRSDRGERKLGIGELDDTSLVQLWADVQPRPGNLAAVSKAVFEFHDDYGCFPPQTLVDQEGRPLLSWRVLILPYMGYKALFRLFHLDEPWDSPHNRKLIPYMPEHFSTAERPLPPGHTNVLALVGPNTAFPPGKLRRMADFTLPGRELLFLADVSSKSAVEWTKPLDLEVTEDGAEFEQVYRHVKQDGMEYFLGMFGDRNAKTWKEIPTKMSQYTLRRATQISK